MQDFSVIGDFLKSRYDKAQQVGMNQDATGLINLAKSRPRSIVRKGDMVYMDESPHYCSLDHTVGK